MAKKKIGQIAYNLVIALLGMCGCCFFSYSFLLERPGYFKQFDHPEAAQAYLLENLTLYVSTVEETQAFMQRHLIGDDGCGSLHPIVGPKYRNQASWCILREGDACDALWEVATGGYISCGARSGPWYREGFREYGIRFEFDTEGVLQDVIVEYRWNGP